jgi:hypothetical protein
MGFFKSKGKKPIEKFIKFWTILSISVILLLYFFSATREINNKYNCGFNVYFNNWNESKLSLLEQQQELIEEAKLPPKNNIFLQEFEDARKDLKKRNYLTESQIREAEQWIQIDEELRAIAVASNKKRQKEITACLQYIK